MNKVHRLFVGIPLSTTLKKRLGREMQIWPKEAVLQTAEENLHVTLFFLGFVQEENIPEVCAKVGEVCRNMESFEIAFTGMKLVDSEASPKMIWLAGEKNDHLRRVVEAIEKAFSSFITERKTYRPHITLAKIKKAKWKALSEKPKLKESYAVVEPVDAIAVFESLAIDGKRRYIEIDAFALQ